MKICTRCGYTTDAEWGSEILKNHTDYHVGTNTTERERAIWKEQLPECASCGKPSDILGLYQCSACIKRPFELKIEKLKELANLAIQERKDSIGTEMTIPQMEVIEARYQIAMMILKLVD